MLIWQDIARTQTPIAHIASHCNRVKGGFTQELQLTYFTSLETFLAFRLRVVNAVSMYKRVLTLCTCNVQLETT
jgi:hypothetical protein